MSDARREQQEIEDAAKSVLSGEDTIQVPKELLEEKIEREAADAAEEPPPSLYAQIQAMNVAQKVKLALRGNKDARNILIRSTNRLVQRMVLQNPRITEDEILMLAKNRNSDDEILRIISDNREWTSSYPVRIALVENAKTPLVKALRFLPTLSERDIRGLAKSKNVPNVIATQARKIIFQRESIR